MIKKITAILLALCFSLSCVWALAEEAPAPALFANSETGEEFAFLKAIGIVLDEDIKDDTPVTITRGELAVLAARALYPDGIASGNPSVYADVPSGHFAYDAINTLTATGIFSGTSGGMFLPDENATMEQAITVAVRMTNLDRIMRTDAGYPASYIMMASERRMLKNINVQSGTASRSAVYILIYNALNTDMLILQSFGSQQEFLIEQDRNILTEYWGIYKDKGVITADNSTAVSGKRTLEKDSIEIDGVPYKTRSDLTQGKVGRFADFYYKLVEDEKEVMYVDSSKNTILHLSAKRIAEFDYEKGTYTIFENDKERILSVGKNYLLSYNGDAVEGSDREKMMPQSGSVTLIDHDGDGIYDVIMSEEYYNLSFDRYDTYKNTIFGTLANETTTSIALDDYDNIISNVEIGKMAKNNVITVYKSPSKSEIRFEVSSRVLQGKVQSVSIEGEQLVQVDGEEYEVSDDPQDSLGTLRVGDNYSLYLDIFGRIAFATSAGGDAYGFLLKVSEDGNHFEKKQAQILEAGGTLAVYDLASRVAVKTMAGTTVYSTSGNGLNAIGEISSTIVIYTTNKEGEITSITVPYEINTLQEYNNPPIYPLFKINYFLLEWPGVSSTANKTYRYEIRGFDNWLIFDEKTMVMEIPPHGTGAFTDENVVVSGISAFNDKTVVRVNKDVNGPRGENDIEIYKIGTTSAMPNILVNYRSTLSDTIVADKSPAVITDVSKVLDPDTGESATKLTFIEDSVERSLMLADEKINTRAYLAVQNFGGGAALHENKSSLGSGDIIKYAMDRKGKISSLYLLYDALNHQTSYANRTAFDVIFRLIGGEITKIEGDYAEMLLDTGIMERTTIKGVRVVVCDTSAKEGMKVTTGSLNDVSEGDRLALYARYVLNRVIVVYK